MVGGSCERGAANSRLAVESAVKLEKVEEEGTGANASRCESGVATDHRRICSIVACRHLSWPPCSLSM